MPAQSAEPRLNGRLLLAVVVALLVLAAVWWWSFAGPGRERFRSDAPTPASPEAPAS